MIKGLIQQEDITSINIYAHSIGTPNRIKQILTKLKGETATQESSGTLIPHFHQWVHHPDQNSGRKPQPYTIQNQKDVTDAWNIPPPKTAAHTFFSSTVEPSPGRTYVRPQNNS